MKINNKYSISKEHGSNIFTTNIIDGVTRRYAKDHTEYAHIKTIYTIARQYSKSKEFRNARMSKVLCAHTGHSLNDAYIQDRMFEVEGATTSNDTVAPETVQSSVEKKPKVDMKKWCVKLHDFLSEFALTPSYRMVSTLCRVDNPTDYVLNYFKVQENPYAVEVEDKLHSLEWREIANKFEQYESDKDPINTRIKIYYGEPGTGKTTEAINQADGCVVCTADMQPADLMKVFDFNKGQPTFKKSVLWEAIENGNTIVLDEINLLPQDSLCFIQALTDGKETFTYDGNVIKVHPDFNIIGTMNLVVNGVPLPLTSPLVDRCSEIIEYKLNPESLADVI